MGGDKEGGVYWYFWEIRGSCLCILELMVEDEFIELDILRFWNDRSLIILFMN